MLTWFVHFFTIGADSTATTVVTLSASPGRTIFVIGEKRTASAVGEDRSAEVRPEKRTVSAI